MLMRHLQLIHGMYPAKTRKNPYLFGDTGLSRGWIRYVVFWCFFPRGMIPDVFFCGQRIGGGMTWWVWGGGNKFGRKSWWRKMSPTKIDTKQVVESRVLETISKYHAMINMRGEAWNAKQCNVLLVAVGAVAVIAAIGRKRPSQGKMLGPHSFKLGYY